MKKSATIFAILCSLIIFLVLCVKIEQLDQSGNLIAPKEELPEEKLKIEDIKEGDGPAAEIGHTLYVTYTGKLSDGTVFDSNQDIENPFEFTLGAGQVIQGWDQGLVGMKQGGIRTITIPPSLGYGAQTTGQIPANSTLIFEIELLTIKDNDE